MHLDWRYRRALTGSVWHAACFVLSAYLPLFGAGEMRHGAMMARLGSLRSPGGGASVWSPFIKCQLTFPADVGPSGVTPFDPAEGPKAVKTFLVTTRVGRRQTCS